jgi:hypothetical protein
MTTKFKRFYALADQLDRELEKSTEILFKEREFILGEDGELKEVKIPEERSEELIEEKITNEFTIEKIIKELRAFL